MHAFDFGSDRLLCQYRPMDPEAFLRLRMMEIERNLAVMHALSEYSAKGEGCVSLHANVIPTNEWVCSSGYGTLPVQQFIDEYDGKYRLLIIDVPNYASYQVHAKRSFVIHAANDAQAFEKNMILYVPRLGYLGEFASRKAV